MKKLIKIIITFGLIIIHFGNLFSQQNVAGEEDNLFFKQHGSTHAVGMAYTAYNRTLIKLYPGYEGGDIFGDELRHFYFISYIYDKMISDQFATGLKLSYGSEFFVEGSAEALGDRVQVFFKIYGVSGRFFWHFLTGRFAPYVGISLGGSFLFAFKQGEVDITNAGYNLKSDLFINWDVFLGFKLAFSKNFGMLVESAFPGEFIKLSLYYSP